jgi:hypothetical protein
MLSHFCADHGVPPNRVITQGSNFRAVIRFAEVSAPRRYLGKTSSASAYRISGKSHDFQSFIRFSPTTYTAIALSNRSGMIHADCQIVFSPLNIELLPYCLTLSVVDFSLSERLLGEGS